LKTAEADYFIASYFDLQTTAIVNRATQQRM